MFLATLDRDLSPTWFGNAETLSKDEEGIGVDHWFNNAAFALAPFGTIGNVGRNTLLGPRFDNLDFSLLKNTSFGEHRNLQFRAETFNLFNHPNFDLPNRTVDSAQAAGIFSAEASRQIQLALKIVF